MQGLHLALAPGDLLLAPADRRGQPLDLLAEGVGLGAASLRGGGERLDRRHGGVERRLAGGQPLRLLVDAEAGGVELLTGFLVALFHLGDALLQPSAAPTGLLPRGRQLGLRRVGALLEADGLGLGASRERLRALRRVLERRRRGPPSPHPRADEPHGQRQDDTEGSEGERERVHRGGGTRETGRNGATRAPRTGRRGARARTRPWPSAIAVGGSGRTEAPACSAWTRTLLV